MNINNGRTDCIIGEKGIIQFEKKYNATYISDLCLKSVDGNWSESPAAIFYKKKPLNPEYSHYFGIFVRVTQTYITSGASAVEEPINAIMADYGEIIFSRFRHDFRESTDKSVFIDGGRDYTKPNNLNNLIRLQIIDGELTFLIK